MPEIYITKDGHKIEVVKRVYAWGKPDFSVEKEDTFNPEGFTDLRIDGKDYRFQWGNRFFPLNRLALCNQCEKLKPYVFRLKMYKNDDFWQEWGNLTDDEAVIKAMYDRDFLEFIDKNRFTPHPIKVRADERTDE